MFKRISLPVLLVWALLTPAFSKQKNPERAILVSAAHPLAVQAGMDILKQGGDAVDAAVAVQAMLGLVEPQSSGLGGGAFLVRYDAATRQISVYDGRETAPVLANPAMFLDTNGKPFPRALAMTSGEATGVPGVVAMLGLAHQEHGRLPWSGLFEGTAKRADDGFIVTARMARFIHGNYPQNAVADVRAYFAKPDGGLIDAGETIRNPAYARFVRRLANDGSAIFYSGETAKAMVAKTSADPFPGGLNESDIASYKPIKRKAVCSRYRIYLLCTAPPPASGIGLLQLMEILERTDIAKRGPSDPIAWFLFAEASRLMYADRDAWIGDPGFVDVPTLGMLDNRYVTGRAKLIGNHAGDPPGAGTPPGAPKPEIDATREPGGTSHFVIRDRFGNAISMTTTVESYFGSGRMVEGFFLNNQMTDFSFLPSGPNAIAPGKRPRSSMSPVLILDRRGRLLGAVGSPGGNAIPAYVGKTLVGLLDWKLPMQQAIDLPNLVARGDKFNGEANRMSSQLLNALQDRGVFVKSGSGEDSGIHGFFWRNGGWETGADSRRDGSATVNDAVEQYSK